MSNNETGPDMLPPSEPPAAPPPPPTQPPPPVSAGGIPGAEERQWAMFAHLSALLGGILTGAVGGLGVFIGPLVIWLIKKETMPFVDDQGKEALNFNITIGIIAVGLVILSILTFGIGLLLAIPVGLVVGLGWLVFTIIAAIKSNEGVAYRYPLCLRLVK